MDSTTTALPPSSPFSEPLGDEMPEIKKEANGAVPTADDTIPENALQLTLGKRSRAKRDPDSPSPSSRSRSRSRSPVSKKRKTATRPRRATKKIQYRDLADEDSQEDTSGGSDEYAQEESEQDDDQDDYQVSAEDEADMSSTILIKAPATPKRKAAPKTKAPRTPKTTLKPEASAPGTPAKGKWTTTEMEALFLAALGAGPSAKMFEGKVAGRTAKQCYDQWSRTTVPFLLKCLRDRRDGKM